MNNKNRARQYIARKVNRLTLENRSIKTPHTDGPKIYPLLKKMPNIILAVGSKWIGIRSLMNFNPSENNEATVIPLNSTMKNRMSHELSENPASKKIMLPIPKQKVITCFPPYLSLKMPKGTCVKIPPSAKAGTIIEICSKEKSSRSA